MDFGITSDTLLALLSLGLAAEAAQELLGQHKDPRCRVRKPTTLAVAVCWHRCRICMAAVRGTLVVFLCQ